MPIQAKCPNCGNAASLPDVAMGKTARCGRCSKPFKVQADSPPQAPAVSPTVAHRGLGAGISSGPAQIHKPIQMPKPKDELSLMPPGATTPLGVVAQAKLPGLGADKDACPNCGVEWVQGNAVCLSCGFNAKTGVTMHGTGKSESLASPTMRSLGALVSDPTLGQRQVIDELGDKGALLLGAVFIAVIVGVNVLLATSTGDSAPTPLFLRGVLARNIDYWRIVTASIIPITATILGVWAAGAVFGRKSDLTAAVFSAGATWLPLSVFLIAARVLGHGNLEVILLLLVVLVCSMLLMLHAALLHVQGLPSARAFWLTPVVLCASGYLTKIIIAAILSAERSV